MKTVDIYEIKEGWAVECCEPENDGICHKALFFGPDAELHAQQFKAAAYPDESATMRNRLEFTAAYRIAKVLQLAVLYGWPLPPSLSIEDMTTLREAIRFAEKLSIKVF